MTNPPPLTNPRTKKRRMFSSGQLKVVNELMKIFKFQLYIYMYVVSRILDAWLTARFAYLISDYISLRAFLHYKVRVLMLSCLRLLDWFGHSVSVWVHSVCIGSYNFITSANSLYLKAVQKSCDKGENLRVATPSSLPVLS